ncbi:MAG: ATP-binding protein [Filifactoraceae bacterium]
MKGRLVIITGHYGSGKTEFAVNLAINLRKDYEKVSISDLDIVNPYFRSRERLALFEDKGIKVYDSSLRGMNVDVPAISSSILTAVQDKSYISVIDVGGDPVGARVLQQFKSGIETQEYEMWFVINRNRPETSDVKLVEDYIMAIEEASGLKVTGLINNTHLLKATTVQDITEGAKLCDEVSKKMKIPVIYHSAIESIANEITDINIKNKIYPLYLYMREQWMS